MSKLTLYHNPKCSKSRQALQWLEENGQEFELIEYLKTPPTEEELRVIYHGLDSEKEKFIRVKEEAYKEDPFDIHDESRVIKALIENPRLMERPILKRDKVAKIGRPLENLFELV